MPNVIAHISFWMSCAGRSINNNFTAFFTRASHTPLLVLCIMWFECISRFLRIEFAAKQRITLMGMFTVGSIIDGYLDFEKTDWSKYKQERTELRHYCKTSPWLLNYRHRLERYERSRDSIWHLQGLKRIEALYRYRTIVLYLNLRVGWQVVFYTQKSLPHFHTRCAPIPYTRLILPLVISFQIIDDFIDVYSDYKKHLPTFATIFLRPSSKQLALRP